MVIWIKFTHSHSHFSSLVPKMLMFTLAISSLTTFSLPCFADLTFQVPMQYCSSQHWALLSPPNTSTIECHFPFGLSSSFFLELLLIALCSSLVAHGTPSDLGAHLLVSYLFAFSYCSWGSGGKSTGVVCHSPFQWTTFCQNSPPWPVSLGWPFTAWPIASLSYESPFSLDSWSLRCLWDKQW